MSAQPVALAITYFPRLRDPFGQRTTKTWSELCEDLSKPCISADKHDVSGLSFATFSQNRRALANVEHVSAVGLDLDEQVSFEGLRKQFAAFAMCMHSTWSSTPSAPRARVFLLLSRPVTGDEYRLVYRTIAAFAETRGHIVDRAASDPSRFWFLPATPPGGGFLCHVGRGRPVNVERAIASSPRPSVPVATASGPRIVDKDVTARAAAYVAKCGPAISGSGGHTTTLLVARALVRGFDLDEQTAYRLMLRWNARCSPPWSEWELRRKVRQAAEKGQMPIGALRDRERGAR